MLRLSRCVPHHGRLDESAEQRMRIERARLQFGMELASEKPWMPLQLHDLHQMIVRRGPRRDEPDLFEPLAIVVVHFVAMAMALRNVGLAIERQRQRAGLDHAWPRA